MKSYFDSDNNSNIDAYEYGDDYITVRFKNSSIYTYTCMSAGSSAIEEMKRLADCGDGLNSYISKYKPRYQSKS